ncbi:WD40/YVTN repeat-like-containing domain [Phytophthora cinnamomi]|uniref:WD40/YVTN repeat-like-containing domain n=1 Tax=Phytophthora cinnamomi TaxID=4785 RepID=UPI00355A1C7C|nr:WD40/YVTN repeat-like-containing domain [Phytophthora cinnamomi]KAG6613357.1 WD40/YVTN repeat-like-containing domain [Phytophthora cinnamomi]
MEDGAELGVRSARLHGFPPFPTWNGTVAAPSGDSRGLCSVLGAGGELVVLQNSRLRDEHSCLRVRKVLPAAAQEKEKVASFCQCWTRDGAAVATAHDRRVTIYSGDDFRVLARLWLRYGVVSMDVVKRRRRPLLSAAGGDDDEREFLLMVGTAFGALLYKCARLDAHDDDELSTFGSAMLSRVLASPRVASMSFSACSTKLVVATRKGNVYVFTCASETGDWQVLSSCKDLSANPKPKAGGAAGVSKAATAAQTLVACWGPVFVVCSRAVTSRLEMYDFESGCLLHSLQLAPAAGISSAALSTWVDQQLVTGICVLEADDGRSRLLCYDTSTNLALVHWPFLDAMNGRSSNIDTISSAISAGL